jgi:hypothetical protein
VKAVWREALRTGGKIMTDIAANKSPDIKARDIVAARLGESAQIIVRKMRGGGGRKRKRSAPVPATAPKRHRKTKKKTKTKNNNKRAGTPRNKGKDTKRDIFA